MAFARVVPRFRFERDMVRKLIDGALANSLIILLFTTALVIGGGYAFVHVNIEAYPDPAPAIIEVVAQFPGASAEEVERLILKRTDVHFPKPRVVSLTQSTEAGTVYTAEEIAAITSVARRHGLSTHMDGARFANAYATLRERERLSPADITWRVGVDVLCFGGPKNGMNTTEAVVFFNPTLSREFEYRCKQAGQLSSKMRLHSSQWVGMLEASAWLRNAQHANAMAQLLAKELRDVATISLAREPEANAVFATMSAPVAEAMANMGWHFYNFIGAQGYRLMCSWATQPEQIHAFVADLKEVVRRGFPTEMITESTSSKS